MTESKTFEYKFMISGFYEENKSYDLYVKFILVLIQFNSDTIEIFGLVAENVLSNSAETS